MTTITTEGALLAASADDRTLTYRLLPFGEPGRTSLGLVTVHAGVVQVPDDPGRVTLNFEHDFRRPVGRAVHIEEDDAGLLATFRVAGTSAGNDLLLEAAEGLRTGISVELEDSAVRGGILTAGRLSAAASCVRPAYPSALLDAADAGELPADATTAARDAAQAVVDIIDEQTVPADDEDTTEPDAGTDQEDTVSTTTATASAPADLTAARTPTRGRRPEIRGAADLGRLLAAYNQTHDRAILNLLTAPENAAAGDLFAALTDITYDGVNGLSQTITQPQWLGNVWNDREFERKIIPLLGGSKPLTSLELEGWKWGTKPIMAPWAGNKAAVPSGPVTVIPNPGAATRYAGAHDIAREYRDFPSEQFWSAYISAMTNSYAQITDVATGDALIAGATPVTAGAADPDVPLGLVYLVDGALSMLDIATPSWALLAEDLWRSLLLTPYEHTLQYLSSSLGLEKGEAGNFVIQPYSALPDGSVLVGDRAAATSYELPGSPIRIEAENLAQGGIDEGFFGYHGVVINEDEALALVSDGIVALEERDSGRKRAEKRAEEKAKKAAAEEKAAKSRR
jgi:hypothetical protein